jgi:alanine racemase
MMREAWVEVNLAAVRHNVSTIKQCVGSKTQIAAVVKANAYGHGLAQVGRALDGDVGLWGFAVACGEEAVALREAGVEKPILVLGPPPRQGADALVAHSITLGVGDEADVASLEAQLVDASTPAEVHVKLNSGMCRMGVRPDELPALLERAAGGPFRPKGVYSHFATAEAHDLSFAREQLAVFREALEAVPLTGLVRHIANSAALARLPESRLDMVRPGAMLYGLNTGVPDHEMPPVRPALRLVARVAALKRFPKGCFVGYGRAFCTQRPSTIALLPVGYADGYPRTLSGKGEVLIGGRRAPVVGAVNMDSITVDVTDIGPVQLGAEAVLIGRQGDESVTVEECAERAGTIVHEIPTRLGPRLPRIYMGEGGK